ncbi:MAG TPA: hypothetical protein VE127_17790, partial [Solirubrobacteraceae bacterium]|nr:hypothetical protein [Solirubrobacteraceae bacterium]
MRFSAPLAAAVLLSALLYGFAPPSATAAARGTSPAGTTHDLPGGRGPIAAPSGAARSAALTEITGLAPGQISSERACPAAAPGVATCEAHIAVLRSSGAPVRPRVHRERA